MTADAPNDYPYESASNATDAAMRRAYWDVAMGLQKVDGLEPSPYLRQLADEHVQGEHSLDVTRDMLHAYYRERKGTAEGASGTVAHEEADMVSQRIVELLAAGPLR